MVAFFIHCSIFIPNTTFCSVAEKNKFVPRVAVLVIYKGLFFIAASRTTNKIFFYNEYIKIRFDKVKIIMSSFSL